MQKQTPLFLFNFFNDLKENTTLELDIEQYQLLIEVLLHRIVQEGMSYQRPGRLLQLCKTLWLSNPTWEDYFEKTFEKYVTMTASVENPPTVMKPPEEQTKAPLPPDSSKEELPVAEDQAMPMQGPPPADDVPPPPPNQPPWRENIAEKATENVYVEFSDIPAVIEMDEKTWYSAIEDSFRVERTDPFVFSEKGHLPFPVRKLQQSWRYFKYYHEKINDTEIDFDRTVKEIARNGMFPGFYYLQKRDFKDTDYHFLIDNSNSMITFENQTGQIIASLQDSIPQVPISKWYFHDYPDKYFFRDENHLHGVPAQEWLKKLKKNSFVFFISDGGAVKRQMQTHRVIALNKLVNELTNITARLLWFNPMPKDRWEDNSAFYISKFIKMLPITSDSLALLHKEIKKL